MPLIDRAKALAKRHWPALGVRAILFGTLLFVAALPGIAAVALRVYENTLVQQTEAELIAQGAVIAAAYRQGWGAPPARRRPEPELPGIDLRADPVLPELSPRRGPVADRRAAAVGRQLAPLIADAAAVTLAAVRVLDATGVVVTGRGDAGLSYAAAVEVRRARAGRPATVLRERDDPRTVAGWLSRAESIRVHHVRPILAGGRVIGMVMLSRSPRNLWGGLYQDRGKIALGVAAILLTLVVLAGLLSRGIARPLRLLGVAAQQVARGQAAVPDPPATAAVEIRDLFLNFATMAERIERRQRYLRDFAAAVSHEFKTPLAGIRGALELLADHDMDDATRRRFLGNAGADAERLSRLVQRLLDLARADMTSGGGDPRCHPGDVARAVAARWPGTVTIAGDGGEARITADALGTVLEVLLDNSRRAGAAAITVTAAPGRLLVVDDGPGIDPADRDRVFEPFFTATRAAGGTGLGLPIARSLLGAFGGRLSLLDHAPGASFAIDLPPPSPRT